MESLLIFSRRHARLVFSAALGAAIVGAVLLSGLSFDANILRLLPQHTPSVREFQGFLRDFGSLDHLYIVFDSTDEVNNHAELINSYVALLRQAPEIESVDAQVFETGKDWNYLADRELYLLGPADVGEALARFRTPRLQQEIAHARTLLSMPSAEVAALVQQDPLGLLSMLGDRMSREKGFVSFDPLQEGYVSKDGRSRLLVVKPKGAPFDNNFCKALFRRLSAIESASRQTASADDSNQASVTIQAAGAYRVALEAERLIRREGIVNSVGSLVVLLLVVFVVFRTPRVMLYGFAPMSIAAVLTLGINGLASGSLTPATSGSAGMLFGLGIDGVVLLYLRFLEARGRGDTPDDAVRRMSRTASSVVLAQATTAATFLALLLIDFPTLQELGGIVGLGIVLCCGFTLLLLPAMLPRGPQVDPAQRSISAAWLGSFVTRAARPIIWATIVVTVFAAAASTRLRLDTSIGKLQAQTAGSLLEEDVADRFGLPRDVLLVLNDNVSLESLLETDARLQRSLATTGLGIETSGIGFMLPPARDQANVSRTILESGITADSARQSIENAADQAGFRPGALAPFIARTERLFDPSARISYDGLIAHGLDSIVSRFIVHRDERYRAVTYLYPPPSADISALRRVVHDVDPDLRLTGVPVINHDLRRQFLPQFLKGIAIGTTAVALLVYLVFRTVRHTMLALLPTILGFVWSAGILATSGIELDLFSLFAAVIFVGIAVDYGIYVLHRYVFDQPTDINEVMTTAGAAIIIACATALIGFGTLVNSSYAPLHTFGIVSIVTLTCCLAASIISLPAIVLETERWSSTH